MKNLLSLLPAVCLAAVVLGCADADAPPAADGTDNGAGAAAGSAVENAVEKTGQAIENAAEETGQAVETAVDETKQALEKTADKTEELIEGTSDETTGPRVVPPGTATPQNTTTLPARTDDTVNDKDEEDQ
jgi:hypothetical protein